MERSAVYRRALAPTVAAVGVTGILGGVLGIVAHIETRPGFVVHWLVVAVCCLVAALWVVRRQALGAGESFWSPPTRRVATALVPSFLAGALIAILSALGKLEDRMVLLLPGAWMLLYGCALHSAGFFTPRGLRLFGWIFLFSGSAWLTALVLFEVPHPLGADKPVMNAHALMGGVFGVGHLAYAVYLHLTERKNAA
jgi:hypothetical protein